ncbi:unnamed protein product [Gadus morhua 'NCC']
MVAPDAMYLTDDSNGAIFPLPSGEFPIGSMMTMGHFEAHQCGGGSGQPHFDQKTLVVRFSEAEANVEAILLKTREALGQVEETFVLTDSQGNEIQDSDGTRTSQFWRQNSRKVFVLLEGEFEDLQQQRRAKVSRREDNTLLDRAEEGKVAAESLENVANAIKKMSEVATAHLQRPSLQPAKDAMSCLVCKAVFVDPQFATCCESLVGCRVCVQRWCASSDFGLKCRAANFAANVLAVRGLSPAADFFRDFEVDA